ncbi:MAG: helix-turn-helix domain-containing protein [Propionicimonas sp.]
MARYDPARGWVGLQGHETIDFSTPRRSSVRDRQVAEFLEIADIALEQGRYEDLSFAVIRFDLYIVARVKAKHATLRWLRRNPLNRRRAMFAMVVNGSLDVYGDSPTYSSADRSIFIVFPSALSAVFVAKHHAEFLLFSFDETAVSPARLNADSIGELDTSSWVFRSTFAYLNSMIAARAATVGESASLRAMTRAMAQALTTTAMRTEDREDLFSNALRIIAEESDNPDLDVDQIATRLGVSRRTLFRVFSEHDTTVASEILLARANRAFHMLRHDPKIPTPSLVAKSGFTSLSSLQRALRAKFNTPLRELRTSLRVE